MTIRINLITLLNELPDSADFVCSGKWFLLNNWSKIKHDSIVQKFLERNRYVLIVDYTGGDHDILVIDLKRKEYTFAENGFYPFCNIYDVLQSGKTNLNDLNLIQV